MTVYELIQRLTEFPSDAEVDFELQKSFGWPAVVDTDEGLSYASNLYFLQFKS